MQEPTQPDPLTPAQIRARRATHAAIIAAYGLSGPPAMVPAGCLFLEHEVIRAVVTQTEAARDYLAASSSQGRLFPQALGEAFGALDPDLVIALDVSPRAEHDDIDGDTGHILSITISHNVQQRHTFHTNAGHTQTIHPQTRLPVFSALETAKEIVRLYQISQS